MRFLTLFVMSVLFVGSVCRADELSDTVPHARYNWERSVTGAALGIVINASATELLKNGIHELRPDRSDNSSFPSRHTSYAFTLASVAAHELYRYSPFWAIAAHAAADAVAMQRVYASRHYPGDVLAGAALGILSTELGYGLSRLIFPDRGRRRLCLPMENRAGLSVSTVALVPMRSHSRGVAVGCGVESSLSADFPLSSAFSLGASFRLRSQPVYNSGNLTGFANGAAVTADACLARVTGMWQFDGRLSAGVLRNFDRPHADVAAWSPLIDITAGASRRVAKALSVGGRLGCDFADMPGSKCMLTLAFVTKAEF